MKVDNLTERGRELLTTLRENSVWMDRKTLADATGKNQLSPHDRALLDELEALQLIETRTITSGIAKKYEYRAV